MYILFIPMVSDFRSSGHNDVSQITIDNTPENKGNYPIQLYRARLDRLVHPLTHMAFC